MKKLILMAGIPGSGKSTWAKKYQAEHPNTYIADTDETRKRVLGSYLTFVPDMSIVWDDMIKQGNDYFATHDGDCTVIMDSTFLDDHRRGYYMDRLKGYDEVTLFMIKFHDYSICFQQNKMRIKEKWVPEETMRDMITRYVNPSPEMEKRFDRIVIEYWN